MIKIKSGATAFKALLSLFLITGTACTGSKSANTQDQPVTVEQTLPVPPAPTAPQPPVAKKQPKELTAHGDTRIDNYYWLNERENPEVIAYLNAENAYTQEVMADTEELQEKLFKEIVSRIKQTDESVPFKRDGYYYYTRYEEGKEYPVYVRKKVAWKGRKRSFSRPQSRKAPFSLTSTTFRKAHSSTSP